MTDVSHLPPAIDTPLDFEGEVLRRLSSAGRRVLGELLDAEAPIVFVLVRTRTRVDVGHWLGWGRVWLACLGDTLAVFAPGRNARAHLVRYDKIRESTYNHVTGELLLVPAPGLDLRRLAVSPTDGRQILAQILHGVTQHAS
jgi:hypothetical protein